MTEKRKSPALRFRGYTDDWEQRKLSHFLDVSSEKNTDNLYTKDDVLSVSGDFGVINQIEFQGRSFAGASVSNYGVVHTGDVVYTKSPLKANPYGIIKANKGKTGIVSVLYGVYHTRENANADFIQMYFEQDTRLNNYLRPLVNKGAKNTLLISDTDALEGEVCLAPTFDEQKTIGQFFDTLDNLITLHQRKLELRFFPGCMFFIWVRMLTWCPATKEQGIAGSEAPRPTGRSPILSQRRGTRRRKNKALGGAKHHA